jgi:hypothetical protein
VPQKFEEFLRDLTVFFSTSDDLMLKNLPVNEVKINATTIFGPLIYKFYHGIF